MVNQAMSGIQAFVNTRNHLDDSRNRSQVAPELLKESSQAYAAAAASCLAASLAATMTGITAVLMALTMTGPVALTMAASYRDQSPSNVAESQDEQATHGTEFELGYPGNKGTRGYSTARCSMDECQNFDFVWADGSVWMAPWDPRDWNIAAGFGIGASDGPVTDSTHACTMQTLGDKGYK